MLEWARMSGWLLCFKCDGLGLSCSLVPARKCHPLRKTCLRLRSFSIVVLVDICVNSSDHNVLLCLYCTVKIIFVLIWVCIRQTYTKHMHVHAQSFLMPHEKEKKVIPHFFYEGSDRVTRLINEAWIIQESARHMDLLNYSQRNGKTISFYHSYKTNLIAKT